MKKYIIIISLFILSGIIIYIKLPEYENGNYGKLIINEVCPSNNSIIKDKFNEYSDYIELYNGYNFDIDLDGYHLTDKEYNEKLWTFSNVSIKAHGYLIVYADGKDICIDNECHTDFKLNKDGETVILMDNKNNVLSRIRYEKMNSDTSYGYSKNKYVYYDNPTPNELNSGKYYRKPNQSATKKIDVYINEYMTKNRHTLLIDNEYSSFIELYNNTNKDISLKGYQLSTDLNILDKYIFPDVVIKSHEYLIVYTTGKNKYDNGVHTNFKLTNDDKYIILSTSNNKIIDKLEIKVLDEDISYGKKNNEWCYFTSATPGIGNNTKCFTSLGGINGSN